jgi:hypothetical protein
LQCDDYEQVKSFRRKFALKYFLRVALSYTFWLALLIAAAFHRTTQNDRQSYFFTKGLSGNFSPF